MIEEHFAALSGALLRTRPAAARIRRWGHQLAAVFDSGGKVLVCGNGGSAAEAQHLTGELIGRFRGERRPLSAIALHADSSAVTAIVNDYGESEVFARQVRAHGRPGDVLLTLSASGASPNVVAAAKTALDGGLTAWAFTGPAPNPLVSVCHDAVVVEASSVATVQEVHLVLVHALCTAVDDALGVTE
ncbi:D-sedoheptulose 7-phosphate isomerase [Amycolatopsis xylanica]|uniref:D-sedoheptulose 7-phosphate isomerase n=1 Tax=Amycolatopsis xylanica TaxID=589385 RepID=A0A1H2TDR7_9PSEU|nr:SIS domain-containing protein [Amycolatopsis xylanica]SDW42086.1 D-sedoheptulose 7-phosphate isomerase [Amycolatopsis xylanica]